MLDVLDGVVRREEPRIKCQQRHVRFPVASSANFGLPSSRQPQVPIDLGVAVRQRDNRSRPRLRESPTGGTRSTRAIPPHHSSGGSRPASLTEQDVATCRKKPAVPG